MDSYFHEVLNKTFTKDNLIAALANMLKPKSAFQINEACLKDTTYDFFGVTYHNVYADKDLEDY